VTTSLSTPFATLIGRPPSGRTRAVLVDSLDYARSVFLQGKPVPWDEPTKYANLARQAQAVLPADVALLPLDRFYAHRVDGDAQLAEAMRAKSRTGYALRTLLTHPGTTRDVIEFATVFASTQREPLVLQIPSPLRWLASTHPASAATAAADLDADDAENASMYVADWLRGFAALPVAAVLLDDRDLPGSPPLQRVDLPVYSPVTNVTDHYGWSLGLRRAAGIDVTTGTATITGTVIPPAFWLSGDSTLPDGDFLLAEIPQDAVPEHVIARFHDLA